MDPALTVRIFDQSHQGELFSVFTISPSSTGPYDMYRGGCAPNATASDDCAAACKNQTLIYSSVATLANCVTAPYVASNLSRDVDEGYNQAAQSFGISKASILDSNYSTAIAQCLSGVCNTTACTPRACSVLEVGNNTISRRALWNCYRGLCLGETYTIDKDIGGIGVSR